MTSDCTEGQSQDNTRAPQSRVREAENGRGKPGWSGGKAEGEKTQIYWTGREVNTAHFVSDDD